jgi:hypothetical protein
MSNALTLHDMSPGLRKVVGRESPRATLAEEPDAGNPLVRIWRGAELGNRSAYSTAAFSIGRVHPPPDWFLVVNLCMETVLLFPSRCGAHRCENAMLICLHESIE